MILVNHMNKKKASEIMSILREKADKIEELDRFNSIMSKVGKLH